MSGIASAVLLSIFVLHCLSLTIGEQTTTEVVDNWNSGFKGRIKLKLTDDVTGGWTMTLSFSGRAPNLQIWRAEIVDNQDDKVYTMKNMPWNRNLPSGIFQLDFMATKSGNGNPPTGHATFTRGGAGQPPTAGPTARPPMTTNKPPPKTPKPTPSAGPSPPGATTDCTDEPSGTTWPITTNRPPKTTRRPPKPTKRPPKPTKRPPKPTKRPPKPTKRPPKTTKRPPKTTKRPPKTTKRPPKPTKRPPKTTKRPPKPTKRPPKTTKRPPKPTKRPPKTSKPTTRAPQPPTPGKYDYGEVLKLSILFYEAQRSGKLPQNNRVKWRKDSALNDKGGNGEDLTGGWYDAGDYVKFGFPMAYSATVLAWGLVEYKEAYVAAGQYNHMLDSIKWVTDYFIKAHTEKYEFYGQVGDGHADHASWGRPEDMTMARPAWKITPQKPGSDLAAETAAALAAASIAFKAQKGRIAKSTKMYAASLLKHAKELYELADKYKGTYTNAIPNAKDFYNSFSGYNDELVWGAAWLYRATKDSKYLSKAEAYYNQFGMSGQAWAFSWDDKKAGVQLLLAQLTKKSSYKAAIKSSLDSWLPGGSVTYTPKGLAWRIKWGANRYAANTAFLALVAADQGISPSAFRDFAKKQIDYMLGDSGRSFVVGFGDNPPQRPHHRSSSCPSAPAKCDWSNYNDPKPNEHVLKGALVGGPDSNDNYKDDRKDYIMNEVATDYNAGFQSAVAGLKQLEIS